MKYALITHDKLKFVLENNEYDAFINALSKNDKVFIIKKYNVVIPLHVTPTVIPFEMWYAQENQRLALTHHRLCKRCLCIISIQDSCTCWTNFGKKEEKNAFTQKLPDSVKETLNQIAQNKSFPKVEQIEGPRGVDYIEEGYIDPESGEEMYQ